MNFHARASGNCVSPWSPCRSHTVTVGRPSFRHGVADLTESLSSSQWSVCCVVVCRSVGGFFIEVSAGISVRAIVRRRRRAHRQSIIFSCWGAFYRIVERVFIVCRMGFVFGWFVPSSPRLLHIFTKTFFQQLQIVVADSLKNRVSAAIFVEVGVNFSGIHF